MEKHATLHAPGFEIQSQPRIYVTALPGRWLLEHSTPSWRINDPERGFQRIVKEERAREIAVAVLDRRRTFPNAIVLATDAERFASNSGSLDLAAKTRFLVVDGQHRLWAQRFSEFEATYGCMIHMGLTEVDMARLFVEINDTQKRVPASLRWDLVRLVRPKDDPFAIAAAELVLQLATDDRSPLYQRIDLTGEQPQLTIKQGSIAPELKALVSTRACSFREKDFETVYEILRRYLAAVRGLDAEGWRRAKGPFYQARVLRVLIRLLPEISSHLRLAPERITTASYKELLDRIDPSTLSPEQIRAAQGSAGMREIYNVVKSQALRRA
jgi:DGQHR domain-containing protein